MRQCKVQVRHVIIRSSNVFRTVFISCLLKGQVEKSNPVFWGGCETTSLDSVARKRSDLEKILQLKSNFCEFVLVFQIKRLYLFIFYHFFVMHPKAVATQKRCVQPDVR